MPLPRDPNHPLGIEAQRGRALRAQFLAQMPAPQPPIMPNLALRRPGEAPRPNEMMSQGLGGPGYGGYDNRANEFRDISGGAMKAFGQSSMAARNTLERRLDDEAATAKTPLDPAMAAKFAAPLGSMPFGSHAPMGLAATSPEPEGGGFWSVPPVPDTPARPGLIGGAPEFVGPPRVFRGAEVPRSTTPFYPKAPVKHPMPARPSPAAAPMPGPVVQPRPVPRTAADIAEMRAAWQDRRGWHGDAAQTRLAALEQDTQAQHLAAMNQLNQAQAAKLGHENRLMEETAKMGPDARVLTQLVLNGQLPFADYQRRMAEMKASAGVAPLTVGGPRPTVPPVPGAPPVPATPGPAMAQGSPLDAFTGAAHLKKMMGEPVFGEVFPEGKGDLTDAGQVWQQLQQRGLGPHLEDPNSPLSNALRAHLPQYLGPEAYRAAGQPGNDPSNQGWLEWIFGGNSPTNHALMDWVNQGLPPSGIPGGPVQPPAPEVAPPQGPGQNSFLGPMARMNFENNPLPVRLGKRFGRMIGDRF